MKNARFKSSSPDEELDSLISFATKQLNRAATVLGSSYLKELLNMSSVTNTSSALDISHATLPFSCTTPSWDINCSLLSTRIILLSCSYCPTCSVSFTSFPTFSNSSVASDFRFSSPISSSLNLAVNSSTFSTNAFYFSFKSINFLASSVSFESTPIFICLIGSSNGTVCPSPPKRLRISK